MNTTDFLSIFQNSKAGAEIISSAKREGVKRRQARVDAIKAAGDEARKAWGPLSKAIDAALAENVAAARKFKDTEVALRRAHFARDAMGHTCSTRQQVEETALRHEAHPAIREFTHDWLLDEIHSTQKSGATRPVDVRQNNGPTLHLSTDNHQSVRARLAALCDGRPFGEELALIADQDLVPGLIAEWKSKLPPVADPPLTAEQKV